MKQYCLISFDCQLVSFLKARLFHQSRFINKTNDLTMPGCSASLDLMSDNRDNPEVKHEAPVSDESPAVKNKGGRPSKLTREVREIFVEAAKCGAHWKLAAFEADVSVRSAELWRKKGEEDRDAGIDSKEARFFRAVTRALGKWGRERWTSAQDAASSSEAQPHQWAYTTRFPEFHPKRRVELTGEDGGPVKVESNPIAELDAALGGKPE